MEKLGALTKMSLVGNGHWEDSTEEWVGSELGGLTSDSRPP